jgi:type II secretory pathway component PulC
MRNKYLNLIFGDTQFGFRLIAALFILLALFIAQNKIKAGRKNLDVLLQEKQQVLLLSARIPELQTRVGMLQEKVKALEKQPRKITFALKGVIINKKEPTVLINNDFYGEKDTVDGFVVIKIKPNSVILRDQTTGAVTEVPLHPEE